MAINSTPGRAAYVNPISTEKAAFAAYFNVARHNALLALNQVAEKASLQRQDNDQDIKAHPVLNKLRDWAALEEQGKAIPDKEMRQLTQVVKGLQKAWPVLQDNFSQAISGQNISRTFKRHKQTRTDTDEKLQLDAQVTPGTSQRVLRASDWHWVLQLLISTLASRRNFVSHEYQTDEPMPPMLDKLLGTWFDAARRQTKERFEFMTQEMAHLLRHNEITKREDPNALYALSTERNRDRYFSSKGSAFFCCLFLDKQQGNEFLKQLRGFKHSTGRASQATVKTFTHYAIRLPFVQIDTESTAQGLGLDILSELTRCPKEIYEHLNDEDQKAFEVNADDPEESLQASDADDWGNEAEDKDPGQAPLNTTRFVRYGDRFVPLVLDYFDKMSSASPEHDTGIRVQLDLGDFYFAAYPKKLPDGSSDVRRLKQKVLRFGLLSQALEAAKHKPQAWKDLEQDLAKNSNPDEAKPYIVPTRAHYHLAEEGGSIPIRLARNCAEAKDLYQSPCIDANRPERYERPVNERPDFWLSPYELVNLAFYQQLRLTHNLPETSYPKPGNLMAAYAALQRRLYENIAQHSADWVCDSTEVLAEKLKHFLQSDSAAAYFDLRPKDLPGDLVKRLLQNAPPVNHLMLAQAKQSLALHRAEGEHMLAVLDKVKQSLREKMKPGKLGHRVLRAGEMATFLAKDILRFQPVQDEKSAHQGKPTSMMYDLLQARLAYFGRDKNSLPALFNSLGLTGHEYADKNHPFLHQINLQAVNVQGIAQFYEAYLRLRGAHLKRLQDQLLKQGEAALKIPAFAWLGLANIPQRLQDKDSLQALAQLYLKRFNSAQDGAQAEPLNLPRGLFRPLITRALLGLNNARLSQEIRQALEAEKQRGQATSVGYLLDLYFIYAKNDGYQDFYCYDLSKLGERIDQLNAQGWKETAWETKSKKSIRQETPNLSGQEIAKRLTELWQERGKRLTRFRQDLEKSMRQRAAQDQVLFMAAKDLLKLGEAEQAGGKQAKAKTAGHDQVNDHVEKDALSALQSIKLQTLKRTDLNLFVPHAVGVQGKTIYIDLIKAKNIGQFKHLNRDRRLPGLLHYFEADRIHWDCVKHELQAYPRAQNQAFAEVLQFEATHNPQKVQANKLPIKLGADGKAIKQSLHQVLLEQHLQSSSLPAPAQTQLKDEVLTLRNAFCHNETPAPTQALRPSAQPLLDQAQQALRPARQQAHNIQGIKDQTVAQHFAQALRQRYQALAPTTAPTTAPTVAQQTTKESRP